MPALRVHFIQGLSPTRKTGDRPVNIPAGPDAACKHDGWQGHGPMALPPVVLVDLVWVGGNVGRPDTSLGLVCPFFVAFQAERACMQQRRLERQELLGLMGNVASPQPVPVPLPPVVLAGCVWVGGHVDSESPAVAGHALLCDDAESRSCVAGQRGNRE